MECPEYVESFVKENRQGVVLINSPPFKTGANYDSNGTSAKTIGVSETQVAQDMKKCHFSKGQLSIQFMYPRSAVHRC